LVWTELVTNVDLPESNGQYLTIADLPRQTLAVFPWSLSGGGSGALKAHIDSLTQRNVNSVINGSIGPASFAGSDEVFFLSKPWFHQRDDAQEFHKPLVLGEGVRDWGLDCEVAALAPYDEDFEPVAMDSKSRWGRHFWTMRATVSSMIGFGGKTRKESGDAWWTWYRWIPSRYRNPLSITFAFVATHNHFVLDRGGKVFKQSAPVIKLPDTATEDDYLDLLGVLNSSTACFWLKQVSHNKGNGGIGGGIGDEDWEPRYEFTGTKLQEFPLIQVLPRERGRLLDQLGQQLSGSLPSSVLSQEVASVQSALELAHERWLGLKQRMVFVQEELDWEVYGSYGLIDSDLTYSGSGIDVLVLGQRAFEIALARKMVAGLEKTAWFERHGSVPITEIPADWPADYVALVRKRLDLIESDAYLGLLERPEYKRRWAGDSWESMQDRALREFVLDKLEVPGLWSDDSGPLALSVAQLADRVRGDSSLVEAVRLLRGAVEVDLTFELGKLISEESVPFLSAYRYKDSGLRKRAEWESVWELQRREDAGESVSIPVPPKYAPTDFRKPTYWKARGKLDVPKERFTSFIGAERPGDSSLIIGWAGWDHLEQARGLARLIVDRSQGDGLSTDALLPLIAGLIELEPWLYQWYGEADVLFGGASPAVFFTGFIDSQLSGVGASRADAKGWKP
jgi:hypothetical protein